MSLFRYSALDTKGQIQKGTLDADNQKHLTALLKEKGLILLDSNSKSPKLQNQKEGSPFQVFLAQFFQKKIKPTELMLFTRQIATLLSSGASLSPTLQLLAKSSESNSLARVCSSLQSALSEGLSLSSAMRQSPLAFPEEYIATISASEESGHMVEALVQLADEVELSSRSKQQLKSALTYPLIMTLVSLTIVVMMMIYVVPQVAGAFSSTGQTLPTMTIIIIALSNFLQNYGIYTLLLLLLALFSLYYYYQKNPPFRLKVHFQLLSFPGLGSLIMASEVSRWARSLALLLGSGVPTLQSFTIASQVINNIAIKNALEASFVQIKEGRGIAESLGAQNILPSFVVHMCQSGEASGNLHELMSRVAIYYEQLLKTRVDLFLKLFEPFLILVMGGAVLLIVLAILLPILQMNQLV